MPRKPKALKPKSPLLKTWRTLRSELATIAAQQAVIAKSESPALFARLTSASSLLVEAVREIEDFINDIAVPSNQSPRRG